MSSAVWGTQPHVLGIGFFAFANKAKRNLFLNSYFESGSTLKRVGPNQAEGIGPSGVAFAGIVNGIGINLSVNEATARSAVKKKDAKTVLALIKALKSQI
ncbi:MAG: hypothetical protein WBP81_32265 [Solirubrobacteraceae bacterium]